MDDDFVVTEGKQKKKTNLNISYSTLGLYIIQIPILSLKKLSIPWKMISKIN